MRGNQQREEAAMVLQSPDPLVLDDPKQIDALIARTANLRAGEYNNGVLAFLVPGHSGNHHIYYMVTCSRPFTLTRVFVGDITDDLDVKDGWLQAMSVEMAKQRVDETRAFNGHMKHSNTVMRARQSSESDSRFRFQGTLRRVS